MKHPEIFLRFERIRKKLRNIFRQYGYQIHSKTEVINPQKIRCHKKDVKQYKGHVKINQPWVHSWKKMLRNIFWAHAWFRVNIFIVEGFNKKDREGVIYRHETGKYEKAKLEEFLNKSWISMKQSGLGHYRLSYTLFVLVGICCLNG